MKWFISQSFSCDMKSGVRDRQVLCRTMCDNTDHIRMFCPLTHRPTEVMSAGNKRTAASGLNAQMDKHQRDASHPS